MSVCEASIDRGRLILWSGILLGGLRVLLHTPDRPNHTQASHAVRGTHLVYLLAPPLPLSFIARLDRVARA